MNSRLSLGMNPIHCFETADLYEERDLPLVYRSLCVLGRTVVRSVPSFAGMFVRPFLSQQHNTTCNI